MLHFNLFMMQNALYALVSTGVQSAYIDDKVPPAEKSARYEKCIAVLAFGYVQKSRGSTWAMTDRSFHLEGESSAICLVSV